MTVTQIRPTTQTGDFVHEAQKMADKEEFRNVANPWFDKTIPIEKEVERLRDTRDDRETVFSALDQIRPENCEGRLCLGINDRLVFPDAYAIGQLGSLLGIGSYYPSVLSRSVDDESMDLLVLAIEHALKSADARKRSVFHVQHGDELRGVMPEGSEIFGNDWYLGVLLRALPGSRLSHWRGDDYTMYGNVLIPDTIRLEADSEYGAMLALSNSQIGKRRLEQVPSLFRAICCNGLIWGQTSGHKFRLNRRGLVERQSVERQIIENIHNQVPLITTYLTQFLNTRSYTTKESMKAILAQVCKDFHIGKEQASAVLQGWWTERRHTPDFQSSLFSVVNAFTRAGQELPNETWVKFDHIGGTLASYNRNRWDSLVSRASRLGAADVDRSFKRWTLESSAAQAT